MKPIFILTFLITIISTGLDLNAQDTVKYSISFPNSVHHEAEVTIEFSHLSNMPLEIKMSRTSPGRYAFHDFAKNVYNVRAYDNDNKELNLTRANPFQWNVSGHKGMVILKYTIFGDLCDGTYLAIDNTHAHLNIPATFMWAEGLEENPIEINFYPANPEWSIATQLKPTDSKTVFTAPNLDYFMDSPTEISNFKISQWNVLSNSHNYTLRLAVHDDITNHELENYTQKAQAVVDEQIKVFGELPNFDYSTYTFIADYIPQAFSDGMEHRNSTILTNSASLKTNADKNLATLSHEFFHCWNMERIRAESLINFDYMNANMSDELWFGEGFSSYYEILILIRAGLITIDDFSKHFSWILNEVVNGPGREINSVVQMSQYATFADAAVSIDPTNIKNAYVSYYPFGEAIALGLDLSLRKNFPGLTLDDFMREVWLKFGKNEIGYTNKDLENVLTHVTNNAEFANTFFSKYVYGKDIQDYEDLLLSGGLILQKKNNDKAWLGSAKFEFDEGKIIVLSPTFVGSPLYNIGIDKDDIINSIDGDSIKSKMDFQNWIDKHQPGDTVKVKFVQRGIENVKLLTLQENPRLEVVPFEKESRKVTSEINAFRKDWLGTQVKK